ncbi:MAG: NAD-dependent epimerase/dehydratase family protein, partial [Gemmatimonadota bacterium]
ENDGVHRTSGRIYKITYGHLAKPAVADVSKLTDAQLVEMQSQPNEWFVRHARRVLQERAADPLIRFREVNVAGTGALARQAVAAGVRRLVFVSSIKVNGEQTTTGAPFREGDSPAPEDPYGQSKLEAEQLLMRIATERALEVVVVRPPLVIGAGVGGNLERLLGTIDRGIPLPLGSIHNRRSLITRDNLARLLVAAAVVPAAAGQLFLAADEPPLSTAELVRLLARGLGRSPRLVPVPGALLTTLGALTGQRAVIHRLTGSLEVDASKARRLLGWEPAESLTDGVVRCGEAYRARTVRP